MQLHCLSGDVIYSAPRDGAPPANIFFVLRITTHNVGASPIDFVRQRGSSVLARIAVERLVRRYIVHGKPISQYFRGMGKQKEAKEEAYRALSLFGFKFK